MVRPTRLSYLPPDKLEEKLGSLGRAIPGVELEIVNEAGEVIKEADIVGELVARGGNIMKGYLGDEAGTAETLKNGWLYTGDLAYRDKDGFFFHTARRKEIIKVGGRRISPKEIEEVIVSIQGTRYIPLPRELTTFSPVLLLRQDPSMPFRCSQKLLHSTHSLLYVHGQDPVCLQT